MTANKETQRGHSSSRRQIAGTRVKPTPFAHLISLTSGILHLQVLEQGGRASYTVLFNTTATHGLPAALNQASNALLRTITGNPTAGIAVRNHPMPTLQNEAAVKFSKVAGLHFLLPSFSTAGLWVLHNMLCHPKPKALYVATLSAVCCLQRLSGCIL